MPIQHSETCSDPALSVAVVSQEAAGGWLEQQGGEYHLLSCFLQRPVCVPFGCVIPWTIPYRISYWNINTSKYIGNYDDRYLLRATIGWVRSISIGIERNNRISAVATIAHRATDARINVSIDRYLRYEQSFEIFNQ